MSLPQMQVLQPNPNDSGIAPNYAPTLFELPKPIGTYVPKPPHLSLVPPLETLEMPTVRVLEERWYQTKALSEIDDLSPLGGKRISGKGYILVAPTGTGKTSIASRAIKKWLDRGDNVLVLVNLDRLLEQMLDDLRAEDIEPLVEKAEHHALTKFSGRGQCVLASCQSLHPKRLAKWPVDSFQHVVADEAHEFHWAKPAAWFADAILWGLTATPFPPQGKSLKKFFHYPYIKTLTLAEAIEGWNDITKIYDKPFLARIKIQPIDAQHIDLSAVKIVGKDFDARELDRQIWMHTNEIASDILRYSEDRPTFSYCPRVQTAEAIAAAMRDMGASAAAYTSNTPDPKATMKAFERGELQHLVSVNMLIKGVNVRKVSCIARVRASLNVGQATQEIGRGTRPCPESGKEDCLILEFNFKTGKKHQLASVIDAILSGDFDPEEKQTMEQQKQQGRVRERMDSLIKSGQELDVLRAAKEARQQLSDEDTKAKLARDDARRAKYQQAKTNVRQKAYDPCVGLTKTANTSRDSSAPFEPATAEQLASLADLSGGAIKGFHLSSEAAETRIAQLYSDKQAGRVSERQKGMMINTLGFDPRKVQNMPKWVASKAIETRRLEMIHELSQGGYQANVLSEAPIWELARMHNRAAIEKKETA